MKKIVLTLSIFVALIVVLSSCENAIELPKQEDSILPERFTVNIPSSLSNDNAIVNGRVAEQDTLDGNEIYEHLNLFIEVGEESAKIVEEILLAIKQYNINRPMVFTYRSDEDGREKTLVVKENVQFEGATWQFQMDITDVESETNDDRGLAMQIFWNQSPIKGVAILKPYNINRDENDVNNAVFRIDYSEAGEAGYEAQMIVSITDLPEWDDRFWMNNMKMFVGKNGDVVELYGNSNHPNAYFYTEKQGFSWSFVAAGNDVENIGVAEVGLPPSNLDATSRSVILEDYSIKQVLKTEIDEWFFAEYGVKLDSESLDAYLDNANAPGFFDENGFVQDGVAPDSRYEDLASRIEGLAPYNPSEVSGLEIDFK